MALPTWKWKPKRWSRNDTVFCRITDDEVQHSQAEQAELCRRWPYRLRAHIVDYAGARRQRNFALGQLAASAAVATIRRACRYPALYLSWIRTHGGPGPWAPALPTGAGGEVVTAGGWNINTGWGTGWGGGSSDTGWGAGGGWGSWPAMAPSGPTPKTPGKANRRRARKRALEAFNAELARNRPCPWDDAMERCECG
ncbi:hypothetical protein B0H14DRAFT_3497395 [Mycena olivaceomarginata]|nr:hypothetical protein B0H14DRAFT_3497395 [Mycena olivaceomarginata]